MIKSSKICFYTFDTEREANTSIFSDDEEDFLEDTSSDENLRYVQFQNLSGLCSNSMFNNWNDSTFFDSQDILYILPDIKQLFDEVFVISRSSYQV